MSDPPLLAVVCVTSVLPLDPIRALFPVVGIVASFIVTAIFIFGGYVVRKLLGDKVTTIDQTDYDG